MKLLTCTMLYTIVIFFSNLLLSSAAPPNTYMTQDMTIHALNPDVRSLDDIYAAASKEKGPLILFAGGDAQAQWDPVRVAFKNRFPNIDLNLTVDFSKYHDGRIDRALEKGEPPCDVVFLQNLHDYPRWKQMHVLLPYKPPTWDDIYNSHKDPSAAYTGATLWQFGKFLYDNTKLSEADLPKAYLDLLDPKWKGKLVLTYPNDDDAVGYQFSLLIDRYGWDFLEALKQQDVQWVRGTATPGYIIAEQNDPSLAHGNKRPQQYTSNNGQRIISFTTAGYPLTTPILSWKSPEEPEQWMSWSQTIAIFKSTPRPETAKLFVAWITSREFQQVLSANGTAPTILKSLNQDNGVASLDDSSQTQLNRFRVYMNDRRLADWYRMQYEMTLGSAQGVSPLDAYGFDDVRGF